MVASKDDFLSRFKPVSYVVVPVPGGEGGTVYIRELTTLEKIELGPTARAGSLKELRERLVMLCVCDRTGKRLFTEADLETIGALDVAVIEPIIRKIYETFNVPTSH